MNKSIFIFCVKKTEEIEINDIVRCTRPLSDEQKDLILTCMLKAMDQNNIETSMFMKFEANGGQMTSSWIELPDDFLTDSDKTKSLFISYINTTEEIETNALIKCTRPLSEDQKTNILAYLLKPLDQTNFETSLFMKSEENIRQAFSSFTERPDDFLIDLNKNESIYVSHIIKAEDIETNMIIGCTCQLSVDQKCHILASVHQAIDRTYFETSLFMKFEQNGRQVTSSSIKLPDKFLIFSNKTKFLLISFINKMENIEIYVMIRYNRALSEDQKSTLLTEINTAMNRTYSDPLFKKFEKNGRQVISSGDEQPDNVIVDSDSFKYDSKYYKVNQNNTEADSECVPFLSKNIVEPPAWNCKPVTDRSKIQPINTPKIQTNSSDLMKSANTPSSCTYPNNIMMKYPLFEDFVTLGVPKRVLVPPPPGFTYYVNYPSPECLDVIIANLKQINALMRKLY